MTLEHDEFVPIDFFSSLLRWWWIAVLCVVIGGGVGLLAHRLKPPVYEAQAVFTASIDVNKIDIPVPPAGTPAYQFTQYDEDIALSVVQAALIQVVPQVVTFAQQNGFPVDSAGLQANATIERKNALWEIRYRSPDPVLAQKVVNYWAQQGFSDLKARLAAGQVQPYVTFDLIQLADIPAGPAYFQTNSFVFSGGFLGLIAGLLLVNLPFFRTMKGG